MKKPSLFLVVLLCLSTLSLGARWRVPRDFATIQDANDDPAVEPGDVLLVGPGTFAGAELTKSLDIRGVGNAVINDGPAHPSGLSQGFRLSANSDGSSISGFTFTTDLAIMNGSAVDGVRISRNTFLDSVQAISNWRGSYWQIDHNRIEGLRTRCGGGIGIFIGDYAGGIVEGNIVSQNVVGGVLTVPAGDCGGYNGSGIVLYADFRWGGRGAEAIRDNYVIHNRVALGLDNRGSVDPASAVGFEITDSRDDDLANPVIYDNYVGFNDWRGSTIQTDYTPDSVEDSNVISRNLGTNRGKGEHPSLFMPIMP